jgi:hypothetical protein
MSYLRGPLTRAQITRITKSHKPVPAAPPPTVLNTMAARPAPAPTPSAPPAGRPPVLPQGVPQTFIRPVRERPSGSRLVYRPVLCSGTKLHFVSSRDGWDEWETCTRIAAIPEQDGPVLWEEAERLPEKPSLVSRPAAGAEFATLPAPASRPKNYTSWDRHLKDHLYQGCAKTVWRCKRPKCVSEPGEVEGDFRARLMQRAREERDLAVEKLKKRYASKFNTVRDRIRRAEARIEREEAQYSSSKLGTAVSFGSALLGALFGRKTASVGNVSRAGSAIKGIGRSMKERDDIARAKKDLKTQQGRLADLESQFENDVEDLKAKFEEDELVVSDATIRPRKSDIVVDGVVLCWTPWHVDSSGIAERAF